MSKDYAHKNRHRQRQSDRRGAKFVPLAGAILGVVCFVSAIIYTIHVYHQTVFFSREHIAAWFNHAKTIGSRKESSKVTQTQQSAENNDIQFDFYTELPNMQVNLPESSQLSHQKMDQSIQAVMTQKTTHTTQKQTIQFIVQLGEFKNQLDASQLRLSLLLAGIETEIIKTAEHHYRVQQGPYQNERQAKSAQRKLDRKGFESSIKEI